MVQFPPNGLWEIRGASDDPEPYLVIMELGLFLAEKSFKDFHQGIHLLLWAGPILNAEGVDGEVANAEFAAGSDSDADRFGSLLVTLDPR
jgi:hypothetical protein